MAWRRVGAVLASTRGKGRGHLSQALRFPAPPRPYPLPFKRLGRSCLPPLPRGARPPSAWTGGALDSAQLVPRQEKPPQRFPGTDLPLGLQPHSGGPDLVYVLEICRKKGPLIFLPHSPPPIGQGLGGPQLPGVAAQPPSFCGVVLFCFVFVSCQRLQALGVRGEAAKLRRGR